MRATEEKIPDQIQELSRQHGYGCLMDLFVALFVQACPKDVRFESCGMNLEIKVGTNTPISFRINDPWKWDTPPCSQNGLVVGVAMGYQDGRNSYKSVTGNDISFDFSDLQKDVHGNENTWKYVLLKNEEEIYRFFRMEEKAAA